MPCLTIRLTCQRFNGAAVFQPRRDTSSRRSSRRAFSLQWGRGLSTAEGGQRSPAGHAARRFNGAAAFQPRRDRSPPSLPRSSRPASMGPRSFNRGGPGSWTELVNTANRLQWGRGLSTAEGTKGASDGRAQEQLQWGRGLPTAQGWKQFTNVAVLDWLQWGRGLSTAEGRGTPVRVSRRSNRFNGAAVFQPRRAISNCAL